MITVLAAIAIALVPGGKWELKPPYEYGKLFVTSLRIEEKAQKKDGDSWTVTETQEVLVKGSGDAGHKCLILIKDVLVDGEDEGEDDFKCFLGKDGHLLTVSSFYGEKMRLPIMTTFFIYPDRPIGIGDKWTATDESTISGKTKFDYEAKAEETTDGIPTLKVALHFGPEDKNKAKDEFSGEGYFWVSKDGIVRKFKLKQKNVLIPWDDGKYELKTTGSYVANPK